MISAVHRTFDFQERYFLQINVNFPKFIEKFIATKEAPLPCTFYY